MLTLIVVPETFDVDGYTKLEAVRVIHPLRLVVIEDRFGKLLKIGCKGIADLKKVFETRQIHFESALFEWNSSKYPMETFEDLLDNLEKKLMDIQKTISLIVNQANEIKTINAENFEELQEGLVKEQFLFIDCLYCAVDLSIRKKFEKFFDPKILNLIKILNNKAVYKIFCIKSERDRLKSMLLESFKQKEVEFIDMDRKDPLIKTDEMFNEEKIKTLFCELSEITLVTAIFTGLAEALNKCGLPPDFKYKIVIPEEKEKEVKTLKRKNKELSDFITIVDIDV